MKKLMAVLGFLSAFLLTAYLPGEQTMFTKKDSYVVGLGASNAPFEFKDEKALQTGFEKELLDEVAKRKGLVFKYIEVPIKDMESRLGKGVDIFAGAIDKNGVRQHEVILSNVYGDSPVAAAFLKSRENELTVETLRDLKGKKVVSIYTQSKENIEIANSLGAEAPKVTRVDNVFQGIKALHTKRADILIGNTSSLKWYANSTKTELITRNIFSSKRPLCIAVNPGEVGLAGEINSALDEIKRDGTYNRLYNKWIK